MANWCSGTPACMTRWSAAGRHLCTSTTSRRPAFHNLAFAIHCRTVSLLTISWCRWRRYSAVSVGPNPRYTGSERMAIACCANFPIGRAPTQLMDYRPVSFAPQLAQQSRHLPFGDAGLLGRLLLRDHSFLAFFRATSLSRSAWGLSVVVLCPPSGLDPVNRTFLLCPYRTFSFCCDRYKTIP